MITAEKQSDLDWTISAIRDTVSPAWQQYWIDKVTVSPAWQQYWNKVKPVEDRIKTDAPRRLDELLGLQGTLTIDSPHGEIKIDIIVQETIETKDRLDTTNCKPITICDIICRCNGTF